MRQASGPHLDASKPVWAVFSKPYLAFFAEAEVRFKACAARGERWPRQAVSRYDFLVTVFVHPANVNRVER